MRLVDFLIALLEAHGQTLMRLAAFFGEEKIIEMIEEVGDSPSSPESAPLLSIQQDWQAPDRVTASGSAYAELENAVHELKLPAMLEFYVWAYPHYRAFIESPLELTSKIQTRPHGPGSSGNDAGTILVEEALAQAQGWIRRLPISPSIAVQAERAAQVPWIRFRAEVLKRIGKRPLGPVY